MVVFVAAHLSPHVNRAGPLELRRTKEERTIVSLRFSKQSGSCLERSFGCGVKGVKGMAVDGDTRGGVQERRDFSGF